MYMSVSLTKFASSGSLRRELVGIIALFRSLTQVLGIKGEQMQDHEPIRRISRVACTVTLTCYDRPDD